MCWDGNLFFVGGPFDGVISQSEDDTILNSGDAVKMVHEGKTYLYLAYLVKGKQVMVLAGLDFAALLELYINKVVKQPREY